MICSQCGTSNKEGARFCRKCGAAAACRCEGCNAELESRHRALASDEYGIADEFLAACEMGTARLAPDIAARLTKFYAEDEWSEALARFDTLAQPRGSS